MHKVAKVVSHAEAAVDAADSSTADGGAPAADGAAPAPAGELRRRHRLMVKRRLYRERKTELQPLEQAERQKRLDEWFTELEGQYRKANIAAQKLDRRAQPEQDCSLPV